MVNVIAGVSANDSHDPVGMNRTFIVCKPTDRFGNTSPDEPVMA